MKEGWEYSTIGDLCDKMNGLWKGKVGPFINVGVIRNANFTKAFTLSFDNIEYLDVEAKQYKTRKLQKGDLIVEKSGGSEKQPVGRTVLFDKEDGEYSFSNFTSVLRIKDRSVMTPEFLYKYILFAYLRGDTRKMQKATTGIHNIEFDKFLSIPVPQLSLSEQQSIVDYLDSAFAKIDAMKANAEKALNEAKALFQASLKEMLEPKEGWEEKTLGEIGTFTRGGNFSKKDFVEDGYPCIHYGQIHMKFGVATYQNLSCVPESMVKKERCASKGDLVIAITSEDDEGSCKCTAWMADYDAYVGGHTAIFKHSLNPLFVSYYFRAERFQKAKLEYTHGFKVVEINPKDIAKIPISYPSTPEQQSIVATLDSLKSKVDHLQENFDKMSQECDTLKQAILKQVFE